MPVLPPLECLRFREAAARHESFVKAAEEFNVSSSAVAHRIKVLEEHLGGALFERRHRKVRLNGGGKAYLEDVQRILAEIQVVEENLLPVCSPTLFEARGRPGGPVELHDWPLLYDLGWDIGWPYWFARQGKPSPDESPVVSVADAGANEGNATATDTIDDDDESSLPAARW